MNYYIPEVAVEHYNAIAKARRDVIFFVEKMGFNPIGRIVYGSKKKYLDSIYTLFKLFKLKRKDTLFLQCPYDFMPYVLFAKCICHFKVIYLIHDIYCIRYVGNEIAKHHKEINYYIRLLGRCDYVIAHNNIMIKKMVSMGFKPNFVNLNIFDYRTECKVNVRSINNSRNPSVSFAGALTRNPFLDKLDKSGQPIDFMIYGAPEMHYENMRYMGSVDANILPSVIEGQYGLLWADDYEQNEKNNYMMYNNPHKMSLYIVSGLPIITWSKYAAADFITKHRIGVAIDNLDELSETLRKITPEHYSEMVSNCLCLREKLICGHHLNSAIDTCIRRNCSF